MTLIISPALTITANGSFLFLTAAKDCLKFIEMDTRSVLRTTSFLNAKPASIEAIFKLEGLTIMSELDLLQALFDYAAHNKALPSYCDDATQADQINDERFTTMVLPGLQQIRLVAVVMRDMLQCKSMKNLFTAEQILGIVGQQVGCVTCFYEMPSGFTVNPNSRGMREGKPVRSTRSNMSILSGISQRTDMANVINVNTAQIISSTDVQAGSTPQSQSAASVYSRESDNCTSEWEHEIEEFRHTIENELNLEREAGLEPGGALGLAVSIAHTAVATGGDNKRNGQPQELQFGDFGNRSNDDSLVNTERRSSTPQRPSIGDERGAVAAATTTSAAKQPTQTPAVKSTKDAPVKSVPTKRPPGNGGGKYPTKKRNSVAEPMWVDK